MVWDCTNPFDWEYSKDLNHGQGLHKFSLNENKAGIRIIGRNCTIPV